MRQKIWATELQAKQASEERKIANDLRKPLADEEGLRTMYERIARGLAVLIEKDL